MTSWKRVGNGLLAVGGCALAVLMIYSVMHDDTNGGSVWRPRGAAEVAVVFPEAPLWAEFREGVEACVRRGIARMVGAGPDWVEIETPRQARRLRFVLNDVRGVLETRDEVKRAAERRVPPIAVVGSSNTVLTVALADALRHAGRPRRGGPALLVPWATAVLVERAEPGHGPVGLLDIDQDRTFRFCANDQSQAELLVRALLHQDDGRTPARVDMIVDRRDPYSVDLADSVHRAVERLSPSTELVEHADAVPQPSLWNAPGLPSVEEEALAESLWNAADRVRDGATHWVFLPLQAEPARRILLALQRHARGHAAERRGARLRVACGDGIGLDVLKLVAGRFSFPVFCYAPGVAPPDGDKSGVDPVLHTDAVVLAEVVAALVRTTDVEGDDWRDADALVKRLHGLNLAAGDPAALGRSIAFAPSGERTGADLGYVLLVEPGERAVFFLGRDSTGRWGEPRALDSAAGAARP